MNYLLVVLPYCNKDFNLAKKLLEWIRGLGGTVHHPILLAGDSGVEKEKRLELKSIASTCFASADSISVNVDPENQNWPKGPNTMFHEASRQVLECYRMPFLWLEPDAVPLRESWLDDLADEYAHCPKKFMGTMATVALDASLPSRHLSGVAVYPQDAHNIMKKACAANVGFDYASAEVVVGQSRAHETKLIHEIWGSHNEIPSFKEFKTPGDANNILTPAAIPKEAVLFHRCKDGSLIDILKRTHDEKFTVEARLPEPDMSTGAIPVLPETGPENQQSPAINVPEFLKAATEEVIADAETLAAGAPPKRRGRPPIKKLASTAGIL